MISTINKIQILEKYVLASQSAVDNVITTTITKLLEREIKRMSVLLTRLQNQLTNFEKQYSMNSHDFSKIFESGELGDNIDYVEWSATLDMYKNTENRIEILTGK